MKCKVQPFVCDEIDLRMLRDGIAPKSQQAVLRREMSSSVCGLLVCAYLFTLCWIATEQNLFALSFVSLFPLICLYCLGQAAIDWQRGTILMDIGQVDHQCFHIQETGKSRFAMQLNERQWTINSIQHGLLLGWGSCKIRIYYSPLTKKIAYIERLAQTDQVVDKKSNPLKRMEKFFPHEW